jgi:hypothetical protein
MVEDSLYGPTVLWGQLKGKKVKTNDGKDLGDIDKISHNYIRLEKGTIKKEKFWVPKYLADAFDGKVLWLHTGEEETRAKFQHGEEPPVEQYERDLSSFKTTPYGQNRTWDLEKVNVTPDRTVGIPTKQADSNENYTNIRDLK